MIAALPSLGPRQDDPGLAFGWLCMWVAVRFDPGLDEPPIEYKSLLPPPEPELSRPEQLEVLLRLTECTPEQRLSILRRLPWPVVRGLEEEWWWHAHGGQEEPESARNGEPWRVWAIVAGRGFGKTRAGAEWVWARAREDGRARIALVAATIDEVVRVMIEGESGLLYLARSGEEARWIPSRRLLLFPSGAEAHVYSAERPEALRGPQHHYAWCDELAKWPRLTGTGQSKSGTAWDNLMLGLRLGDRPRTIVTTTPRPGPLLKRVLALPRCVPTFGRTDENIHLPRDFRAAMREMYGGTRLGRQELEGLLLEEFEGALWSREMLEKARGAPLPGREGLGVGRRAQRDFPSDSESSPPAADPPPTPPSREGSSKGSSSASTRPPPPTATAAESSSAARTGTAPPGSSPTSPPPASPPRPGPAGSPKPQPNSAPPGSSPRRTRAAT